MAVDASFGFLQSPSLAAEPVEDFHVSAGRQDANGWLVHTVQSAFQAGTTEIRVLIPDGPVPAQPYATLYVLPVEAGDGRHWGDAMQEVRRLDLHNRHRLVCVYPTFSHLPWYADHPQQATIRQESYFLQRRRAVRRANLPRAPRIRQPSAGGLQQIRLGRFQPAVAASGCLRQSRRLGRTAGDVAAEPVWHGRDLRDAREL